MSHEIRTPLNGVLGMAQAMARDPLPETQRKRLEAIRQSAEALLEILNDILDLSKIEAGKLELEVRTFSLSALLGSVQAAFAEVAAAKGLAFSLEVAPDAAGRYEGDSARLRQVVSNSNLVSNALKFTEAGSVCVRARRADGRRGEGRESGCGIPGRGWICEDIPDPADRLS